jgi:hypothetical protein
VCVCARIPISVYMFIYVLMCKQMSLIGSGCTVNEHVNMRVGASQSPACR